MRKGDEESFVFVVIPTGAEESLVFDMLQNINGKGFLASLEMTTERL